MRVKEPQELAQAQYDFVSHQVQAIADQTKEFNGKQGREVSSKAVESPMMGCSFDFSLKGGSSDYTRLKYHEQTAAVAV
jgi:hypothetical protein